MHTAVTFTRHCVAIGAMAVAVAIVGGAPLAYGAPACDSGCNVTGANGGSGGKGGSHGAQPTVPTVKMPPPPVFTAQTVVQTAPPPPPAQTPPPPVTYHPLNIPNHPVDTQPPAVVPVNVVPVFAPVAPVPAEVPTLPPPPAAPPAPASTPVSLVLFTSSMEPGTQAATLIVLFMACGCWVYGNRIGGQITVRKKERATASA